MPVAVHIAHSLACAHGNAHDAVFAQAHGAGQRRDVAIVRHHHGNLIPQRVAQLFGGTGVDILYLFIKIFLAHFQKQRGHHALVVNIHTGAGHTNALYLAAVFQYLGRRRVQGRQDALIVIIRVGNYFREPHHFFGIHGLAVNHSGHLAVRPAGVKADARAIGMAANGLCALESRRLFLVGQHFHRELRLVHLLHKALVESAAAGGRIGLADALAHGLIAAHIHLEAAPAPQTEFHQSVHIIGVRLGHVRRAVHLCLIGANLPARALYRDAKRLFCPLLILFEKQAQRHKTAVQFRQVLNRDLYVQKFHRRFSFFLCSKARTGPKLSFLL